MTSYVADTHAIIWHISNDRRLSDTARTVFNLADSGLNQIMVPSIVLVEIVHLIERNRISPTALDRLFAILNLEASNYESIPLDADVARSVRDLDYTKIPEMPDRIIVATANYLGLDILSRDRAIVDSGLVNVVW